MFWCLPTDIEKQPFVQTWFHYTYSNPRLPLRGTSGFDFIGEMKIEGSKNRVVEVIQLIIHVMRLENRQEINKAERFNESINLTRWIASREYFFCCREFGMKWNNLTILMVTEATEDIKIFINDSFKREVNENVVNTGAWCRTWEASNRLYTRLYVE